MPPPQQPIQPIPISEYHVFLASPGDLGEERRAAREFFEEYNETTARWRNVRFTVIDWENYASAGAGRPQELITRQTLEQHRASLALVVGLIAQRFGTPSGAYESGTEEEYTWALKSFTERGVPEIKWFLRAVPHLVVPREPAGARSALRQWEKVLRFREKIERTNLCKTFVDLNDFRNVFRRDVAHWLNNTARPWNAPPR